MLRHMINRLSKNTHNYSECQIQISQYPALAEPWRTKIPFSLSFLIFVSIFRCFSDLLPMFHRCFSELSPMFHRCFSNFSPMFYRYSANLPSVINCKTDSHEDSCHLNKLRFRQTVFLRRFSDISKSASPGFNKSLRNCWKMFSRFL